MAAVFLFRAWPSRLCYYCSEIGVLRFDSRHQHCYYYTLARESQYGAIILAYKATKR